MLPINVEEHTGRIYDMAHHDPLRPPGAVALASALLGAGCVLRVDPREVWGLGELVCEEGTWRILVSRRASPTLAEFTVFHELWHWWIRELGLSFDWRIEEQICDAGAAALQAPRETFLDALHDHGDDLRELAEDFSASETAVALRIGEVTGRATAVLFGGAKAWVRGGDRHWTPEAALTASGERWRRLRICDAKARTALLSA